MPAIFRQIYTDNGTVQAHKVALDGMRLVLHKNSAQESVEKGVTVHVQDPGKFGPFF
jgi:hypothetical protein